MVASPNQLDRLPHWVDHQIAHEECHGEKRSGLSCQALAPCTRCRELGHSSCTCKKRILDVNLVCISLCIYYIITLWGCAASKVQTVRKVAHPLTKHVKPTIVTFLTMSLNMSPYVKPNLNE
ncbi:hypothetical protein COCC4DRAFT_143009 [Bipolaris maydis ATCC 48331]|uniref:Uncharacterized protein n=2 Tax=Cochliobolus heterostrophus TaxID=5016 RepID=M2U1Q7_COCH5|nr:uncharacterized protein COCC4DRAFT_143009 [Bipolaris maydis ATCC 48331]EMD87966.1 hypothetical protein COCHEDRAFT_1112305 [Bipolaris maydis C5]ENI03481.1 hypothetical protein COCC4DRAFT_143009 [Bipolaris maydis ATCC 48331]